MIPSFFPTFQILRFFSWFAHGVVPGGVWCWLKKSPKRNATKASGVAAGASAAYKCPTVRPGHRKKLMPWSNFTWKINGWNPKSWRFGSDHVPFQLGAFELQNLNFRHQESKAEKKNSEKPWTAFSMCFRKDVIDCCFENEICSTFFPIELAIKNWITLQYGVGSAKDPPKKSRKNLSCRCFRLDLPGRLYPRRVESLSRKKHPGTWMFPKIVVLQNGWFIMENPIKMDDLGVPLFSETPTCCTPQKKNITSCFL